VIVVADTSVILNLCCVKHGELLRALFKRVWIPEEVRREFERLSQSQMRFHDLTVPDWVEVHQVTAVPAVISTQPGLHSGEMAALALALEHHADAVLIDESAGRRAARFLGLPVIGVLGILLHARKTGLIPKLLPVLLRLEHEAEFWLAPSLIEHALREVGEISS
jgi:uncharacterized protein